MKVLTGDVLSHLRPIRWFEWLNHAYVVVAIIANTWAFIVGSKTDRELIFGVSLVGYFGVLLVVFVATVYMYGKKARFAEATRSLHNATHAARDAFRYLMWCMDPQVTGFQFSSQHFATLIERCMTATATGFSLTTGVTCRASIKLLGWNANEDYFFVRTLVRDSQSTGRAKNDGQDETREHKVEDNTDFRLILRRKQSWFTHGNLPSLEHYENSSMPKGDRNHVSNGKKWSLPYKSTIVLPIRYVYTVHDLDGLGEDAPSALGDLNDQDLYGFLAIDCDSRNAFDERFDVEMANAVADALVPILHAYSQVREMKKPQGDTGVPL